MNIATERLPGCQHCESHSGTVQLSECYGCLVRFLSRQMLTPRQRYYEAIQQQHGPQFVEQLRLDVSQYLAKHRRHAHR